MKNSNLTDKYYQPPIQRLAMVIRDTLDVTENTLFIGRENLANQDFNAPVISIEQSGSSEVKGFSETYRRHIEVMEYSQHEKIIFDVNFWGKQALQRAQILLRLLRSQKGFEPQWKHNISLFSPTGVRDLHFATGSQYRARVMFSLNAYVADYLNVSTPSIEHLSFQLFNKKGLNHER
ncbi:MAG: LIC_12616 family protein [Candidatus Phlomobacter fragariae]